MGALATNCSVLWSDGSADCLVIDPGDERDRIEEWLTNRGLRPVGVVLTHAHVDHAGAAGGLARKYGAPLYLHPADRGLLANLPLQANLFGLPDPDPIEGFEDLSDGQVLSLGKGCELVVRHTPGHSPGHVCLLHSPSRTAWVGDLVFAGSVGRTDLPGGDEKLLLQSIRNVILALDDDWNLVPGHGPATTVGQERRHNPFLQGLE